MLIENLPKSTQFQSVRDEINWHLSDADLGFTKAQHRLGLLYLESENDIDAIYQAYKWLFISVFLGNQEAKDALIDVNVKLDYAQIDEAYELAETWFEEKFDEVIARDESMWSPELMKWRFALPLVH